MQEIRVAVIASGPPGIAVDLSSFVAIATSFRSAYGKRKR